MVNGYRITYDMVISPPTLLTSTTPMTDAPRSKRGSHDLTLRQEEALETIRKYVKENGFPPTRAEIGEVMGLKHQSAVDNHLHALAKKQYVQLRPGFERGIRLLREGVPLYEPADLHREFAGRTAIDAQPNEAAWLAYDLLWKAFKDTPDVCMWIRDEDMKGIGLTEGAIVALRLARPKEGKTQVHDGDLVAAHAKSRVIVRRFRRVDETTAELRTPGCTSEAIRLEPTTDDVQIIGVVIGRMLPGGG